MNGNTVWSIYELMEVYENVIDFESTNNEYFLLEMKLERYIVGIPKFYDQWWIGPQYTNYTK